MRNSFSAGNLDPLQRRGGHRPFADRWPAQDTGPGQRFGRPGAGPLVARGAFRRGTRHAIQLPRPGLTRGTQGRIDRRQGASGQHLRHGRQLQDQLICVGSRPIGRICAPPAGGALFGIWPTARTLSVLGKALLVIDDQTSSATWLPALMAAVFSPG